MSGKYALVIANTEYADPELSQLPAPGRDANEVARVLYAGKLCAFDDVIVLFNESVATVTEAIDYFLSDRRPTDLLVLYFAGHCIRSEFGSLYFAVRNTRRTRLRSTAISSEFIREGMDHCSAQQKVLILDSYNSSVLSNGTKAEAGGSLRTGSAFEGTSNGPVVLAASDSVQFAWQGDKVVGDAGHSLFSKYLVKGLEGEADTNADGHITVDELYDYARGQILTVNPDQTPEKWTYQNAGEIVLRQNLPGDRLPGIPLDEPAAANDEGSQLTQTDEAPETGAITKSEEQLLYEKLQQERRLEAEQARLRQKEKFEQLRRAEQISRWRPFGIAAAVIILLGVGFAITQALASQPEPFQTPLPIVTRPPTEVLPTATEAPILEPGEETEETVETLPASTVETPAATAVDSTPALGIPNENEVIDGKGVQMVFVPEGNYMSGNENGDIDEVPVHSIFLDSFYIDKFEVTNALYQACVNEGSCRPLRRIDSFTRSSYFGNPEYDEYPVVYVDWNMANAFCEWRGAQLPTEAQWEKAARGPDGRTYPWGEEIDCRRANFQGGLTSCPGGTSMVGSYETGRSPYGAHDMAGNVWEWVADWYSEIYYETIPPQNPLGPEIGQSKVLRGGSWADDAPDLRVSNRLRFAPTYINFNIGFRCASSPPEAE